MKNKTAFSLLELAVVIIIIGLISTALVKGVSIIRSSRLTMARSLTISSKIGEINGLMAWYETSMLESLNKNEAVDEAQVVTWYDLSAGSIAEHKNTLTKTAGSDFLYEADGINSLPSMKTSSNGKIAISSFYQGPSSLATFFIVFRPKVAPDSSTKYILDSSASSSTQIGIMNNAVHIDAGNAVTTSTTENPARFLIDNNYIMAVSLAHSASKIFVNDATNPIGATSYNTGSNPITGITIGADNDGAAALDAFISEVLVFNRVLNVDERKAVMAYLSKKYKIMVTGI